MSNKEHENNEITENLNYYKENEKENILHKYKTTENKNEEQSGLKKSQCQISIDSDDEERKLQCGGFVKEEQLHLPRTETTNNLALNQMREININQSKYLAAEILKNRRQSMDQ